MFRMVMTLKVYYEGLQKLAEEAKLLQKRQQYRHFVNVSIRLKMTMVENFLMTV